MDDEDNLKDLEDDYEKFLFLLYIEIYLSNWFRISRLASIHTLKYML